MRTAIRHFVAYAATSFIACACTKSAGVAPPVESPPPPPAAEASSAASPEAAAAEQEEARAEGEEGEPRAIADDDIALELRYELIRDEGVPAHAIDIEVHQGIVELSGYVDNLLARQRAVEIAQDVVGVRSVVDEIEVQPAARPDFALRRDVQAALRDDPALAEAEIQVSVEQGKVTLSGEVESFEERQLARMAASGVQGVTGVDVSSVKIEYGAERTDGEIAEDVRRRLATDVRVDAGLVDVSVKDGVVDLSGIVGSAAERRVAALDAWVNGVVDVKAKGLKVEWWERDNMRREQTPAVSDDAIRQAVNASFLYDPRVISFEPQVRVDSGIVTLTGTVPSLLAKRAAEQDAKNTVGVWRVYNLLSVKPLGAISDRELQKRIEAALERDPYVSPYEIGVEVHNGIVFLYGNVSNDFERRQAEMIPKLLNGVVEVKSALAEPAETPARDDWEIESDIERRLFWNPYVDSERVHVDVDGGVVVLSGTLPSYRAYNEALEIAYAAHPVRVDNELRVENGPDSLKP